MIIMGLNNNAVMIMTKQLLLFNGNALRFTQPVNMERCPL
jgi:hypothetical protein